MGLAPDSRGPVRDPSGILNWRRWLVRAHASVALTPGRSPKRAFASKVSTLCSVLWPAPGWSHQATCRDDQALPYVVAELASQWQDELFLKFGLCFDLLTNQHFVLPCFRGILQRWQGA